MGETTETGLREEEEAHALFRLAELAARPIDGSFDYDHMKAIHRCIVQDVYERAGQERVGPVGRMTKAGPDVVKYAPGDPDARTVAYGYYPEDAIAEAAALQYRRLARKQFLTGLDRDEFVTECAETWAELNVAHSFREGNTRTQFVFFSQLAEQAGHRLDTEAFMIGAPLRDEFVWPASTARRRGIHRAWQGSSIGRSCRRLLSRSRHRWSTSPTVPGGSPSSSMGTRRCTTRTSASGSSARSNAASAPEGPSADADGPSSLPKSLSVDGPTICRPSGSRHSSAARASLDLIRTAITLVAKTDLNSDRALDKDIFTWGTRARHNARFGNHQLAVGAVAN